MVRALPFHRNRVTSRPESPSCYESLINSVAMKNEPTKQKWQCNQLSTLPLSCRPTLEPRYYINALAFVTK